MKQSPAKQSIHTDHSKYKRRIRCAAAVTVPTAAAAATAADSMLIKICQIYELLK